MFAPKLVVNRYGLIVIAIVVGLTFKALPFNALFDRGGYIKAGAEKPLLLEDLTAFEAYTETMRDGDIIFRGRKKGWGNLASALSDQDQRYGHVGVIRREGQTIYVIHASGDPLQPEGRVREDSLQDFLARSERSGVYRLPLNASELTQFRDKIRQALVIRLPFDRAYSLQSETSVYCTELIWRAWVETTQKDPVLVKTRWRNKNVLALDDLQFAQGVVLIAEIDILVN